MSFFPKSGKSGDHEDEPFLAKPDRRIDFNLPPNYFETPPTSPRRIPSTSKYRPLSLIESESTPDDDHNGGDEQELVNAAGEHEPFLQRKNGKVKRFYSSAELREAGIHTPSCSEIFLFGRSLKDRAICCGFYMSLWIVVIAVTVGFLAIEVRSGLVFVSLDRPRLKTEDSAFSIVSDRKYNWNNYYGNPALGFRPKVERNSNLIWFIPGKLHPNTWAPYAGTLDAFLESK